MYSNGLVGLERAGLFRSFAGEEIVRNGLSVGNGMEGGSSSGGGAGDDPDASDPHRKKKRYHRHTARQIQELEA